MNIKKKCVYLTIGLLTIIISIFFINAVVDKDKPYHSPNDILITIDGYTMTLKEAIINNVFVDGATQSYTTEVPNPGHIVDNVLITINGHTMTLKEAIDNGFLTGENTPTQDITTEISGESHSAIEIEVDIDSSDMSLQEAIDTGELVCIPDCTCAIDIYVGSTCIDPNCGEICEGTKTDNIITTVDATGLVEGWTSITIGTDNLPIVSYSDYNYDLKILKCGNNACTSGNTITTADSPGEVGRFSSITIGSDNLPVLSYHDSTNTALKILKCGNNACTSGNTITTIDSVGSVGFYTSITIGIDNLPIVSYHDSTNTALKILKCGNNACTSGNTITTIDSVGSVGFYSSITIGSDNLPIVSYFNSNHVLKILKCGNNACTSGNTITTVDGTTYQGVGYDTSITIGSDNLPIVSYSDYTNNVLKILKCGNNACTSGNTITTIESIGSVGYYTSITIGFDNLPIVSYFDYTNKNLKILKCGDNACTSANTITTVDGTTDNIGKDSSITIGIDNLPIVSYHDSTNHNLKILKCGTDACLV